MKKQCWYFTGSDRWICTGCSLAEELTDIIGADVTICHHIDPSRDDEGCASRKLSREFTDEFKLFKSELIKRHGEELANEMLKETNIYEEET